MKTGKSGKTKKGPQATPMTGKPMKTPQAGSKVGMGVEPGGLPFGKGPKKKMGTG